MSSLQEEVEEEVEELLLSSFSLAGDGGDHVVQVVSPADDVVDQVFVVIAAMLLTGDDDDESDEDVMKVLTISLVSIEVIIIVGEDVVVITASSSSLSLVAMNVLNDDGAVGVTVGKITLSSSPSLLFDDSSSSSSFIVTVGDNVGNIFPSSGPTASVISTSSTATGDTVGTLVNVTLSHTNSPVAKQYIPNPTHPCPVGQACVHDVIASSCVAPHQ
jgi:hypothetical protein